MSRGFLVISGLFGASGVVLGAVGAHALRDRLTAESLAVFRTAVVYHLLHAVLLALVASFAAKSRWFAVAGWFLIAGILLFCGSLYVLTLAGTSWLGPVTPAGGLFLTAAWLCLAIGALRR